MTSPLLHVSHIDVSYGNARALFDVSLEVAPGEVLAVLGANGAGKSSLLRIMAGEDHDRNVGIRFLDPVQQIKTGTVGKLQIDDGDVGDHPGNGVPAGLQRVGDLRFVTPFFDHVGHTGAGRAIIINDQHFLHLFTWKGQLDRNLITILHGVQLTPVRFGDEPRGRQREVCMTERVRVVELENLGHLEVL